MRKSSEFFNGLQKAFACLLVAALCISCIPIHASASEPHINGKLLTQMAEQYCVEHFKGNEKISIGFCLLETGEEWYYNGDEWMYPASIYKVPVSMLVAEQEASGLITQETPLGIDTLGNLEYRALVNSDNDAGHALIDYLGGSFYGKCSGQTIVYTDLDENYFDQLFYDKSYYTARYITQVFKTLYNHQEMFPHVIEYLLQAHPEGFEELMGAKYEKSQKYGVYQKNAHCSGIVYTPSPIIITVFTYDIKNFKQVIREVGNFLCEYAEVLAASQEEQETITRVIQHKIDTYKKYYFSEDCSESRESS